MFDFDDMETRTLSEAGTFLSIMKLDGSPLTNRKKKPVRLKLQGPDSDTYRSMTRASIRKRLSRAGDPTDATALEDEKDALEIMIACTVDWEGVLDKETGEPVPFTKDGVRQLYEQFPAIRDQADYFMAQRGNFTLASSKS